MNPLLLYRSKNREALSLIWEESSMANSPNHSKESIYVIVIPLSNDGRKLTGKHIELDCHCYLKRARISKVSAIRSVLNEIQGTQNWRENYSPRFASRCALVGKILIKSPGVLQGILFHLKGYLFTKLNNCRLHQINFAKDSLIWYSNSASRIGFPWSREVFINSLNVIRDPHLEVLVFSYFDKNTSLATDIFSESIDVVIDKLQKKDYIEIRESEKVDNYQEINSWNNSKLFHIENTEILHGTVLLNDGNFISQDRTNGPYNIAGRMTPCSVWSDSRLRSQGVALISPYARNKIETIDSGLFINASDSFYHFISESIRPLVQSLQKEIYIPKIIIRNDLPFQFYELIRFLSPKSVQILVGRGEKVLVKNLLAGVLEDRLSLTNKVFSEYSLEDLKITDEWQVWSWIRNISKNSTLQNKVLYLPRRKSESRGIQNSNSLEKSLSKNHVDILNTSKTDFNSQYSHFKNSKLVCSTSGASLVNMIFMPTGSTLLEITYPFGHSWKFLADLCGIQHITFPIYSIKPKQFGNALDVYYVNRNKLNETIKTLVELS